MLMFFRYAYHYDCPQTFCYDGLNLLILRFRASSRQDIKTCQVDCWMIPSTSSPTTTSMRYAFNRLLSDGFHRVVGQANNPPISVGPYQRNFEWYSGRPYWTGVNTTQYACPAGGYERALDIQIKSWYWEYNGTFFAWDTTAFR